jgi:hypothetical protein
MCQVLGCNIEKLAGILDVKFNWSAPGSQRESTAISTMSI